jgi:hypothetical protein
MSGIASPELVRLLERVFDDNDENADCEPAELARRRFDFVFHMTDGLRDLGRLNEIASAPENENPAKLCSELYGLLSHVIPHLRAAFRAWQGEEARDPFLEPAAHPAGTNGTHSEQVP